MMPFKALQHLTASRGQLMLETEPKGHCQSLFPEIEWRNVEEREQMNEKRECTWGRGGRDQRSAVQ